MRPAPYSSEEVPDAHTKQVSRHIGGRGPDGRGRGLPFQRGLGAALEARITAEAKTAGLSAQEATELQGKVDAELKRAPAGAKQISLNQIAYRDGAVITLTLPGEKRARAVAGTPNCPYGSACLWEHANFEGTRFERSLPCHTWIDLGAFRDRASSYQDNQTAAAYHVTYNDGQGVLWSTQNTNGLSSYVGDSRNDRADWIMLTGAC